MFGYYGDDKDPGTSGTFTFSNTPLVHPFVDYTPSIGIGVAVLFQTSGTALESITKGNYETQGRFKGLASVKESFGRATYVCLLYTSPSPRDLSTSRMPSSA